MATRACLGSSTHCPACAERYNLTVFSSCWMRFQSQTKDFCLCLPLLCLLCDASGFINAVTSLVYSILLPALALQNHCHLSLCIINSPPISDSIESTFSPLPVVSKLYTQLISKYQFRNLARWLLITALFFSGGEIILETCEMCTQLSFSLFSFAKHSVLYRK